MEFLDQMEVVFLLQYLSNKNKSIKHLSSELFRDI